MIVYFQQGQRDKEKFFVVQNSDTATHYQEDGGEILPIDKLTLNNDKPLPLPALNFDDDNDNEDEDNKKKAATGNAKPLPLPQL